MMEVLQPGLLTSVQDFGRYGFQRFGVIVSGAMDGVALRIANLLVGNEENAPGLEITLLGPQIRFEHPALIALTGDGLVPIVDGEDVPLWRQISVKSGSVLEFRPLQTGCRCYLAVSGGISVPKIMGSASTYLRAGLGGFEGRALCKGDRLSFGPPTHLGKLWLEKLSVEESHSVAPWFPNLDVLPDYRTNPILRVVPGHQQSLFPKNTWEAFQTERFLVTPQSDRMGYRLQGPTLALTEPHELVSEAVTTGTIQVPPEGNPIVLMTDHQTIGGYPKIAQVITADIPVLAQVRPGELVRFEVVSIERAQELLQHQERQISLFNKALELHGWR